jgi:hypothetical protein
MPRVREVTMDGVTMKISPLSWDETKQYVEEGQALLNRDPKPTQDDWTMRTIESVCLTLNKAAGYKPGNGNGEPPWNPKRLTAELDMPFVLHLYSEFMKISGLKVNDPGEAPATSTSS